MALAICPFCDSGFAWNNCSCKYAIMAQRRGLIEAKRVFFADGSVYQVTKMTPEQVEALKKHPTIVPCKTISAGAGADPGVDVAARSPPSTPDQQHVTKAPRSAGSSPATGTKSRKAKTDGKPANSTVAVASPTRRVRASAKAVRVSVTRAKPPIRDGSGKRPGPDGQEPMAADAGRPPRTPVGGGTAAAADIPRDSRGRRQLLAPKGECGFCDLRRTVDGQRVQRHRQKEAAE